MRGLQNGGLLTTGSKYVIKKIVFEREENSDELTA